MILQKLQKIGVNIWGLNKKFIESFPQIYLKEHCEVVS